MPWDLPEFLAPNEAETSLCTELFPMTLLISYFQQKHDRRDWVVGDLWHSGWHTVSGFAFANIIPIFRKGSRGNPRNYKPMTLTSVVGKLVQSIIKNQITGHMDKYDMLRKSQQSFVKGNHIPPICWNPLGVLTC